MELKKEYIDEKTKEKTEIAKYYSRNIKNNKIKLNIFPQSWISYTNVIRVK